MQIGRWLVEFGKTLGDKPQLTVQMERGETGASFTLTPDEAVILASHLESEAEKLMDERGQMIAAHSSEPWRYLKVPDNMRDKFFYRVDSSDCFSPCMVYGDGTENRGTSKANARRIVAAVNACTGIKTEHLESNIVLQMADALRDALDVISELADMTLDRVDGDYWLEGGAGYETERKARRILERVHKRNTA